MTTYLDKVQSNLKSIQSQQILTLINKEKDLGRISTVAEFRERLEELTAQVTANIIQPTLTLYLANVKEIIDSESFNFMIERIYDDLKTGYNEANNIDELIDSHETLINDVVLKNLDIALNELEAKISSYEFLNKNQDGFDESTFNTFKFTQSNQKTNTEVLFLDPKGQVATNIGQAASVDVIGEKLLLKTAIDNVYVPASIRQVFDGEATGTELNVEIDESNINNIIDNTKGTFWAQSVMLSRPNNETGVCTKLEIDMGLVRSINAIEIDPIVEYPVEIAGIDIVNANNQIKNILSEPFEIKSINKFYFNTVSAKKVILKFKNKNYTLSQFVTKAPSPIPKLVGDLSNFESSVHSVTEEIKEVVSIPRLRASFNVPDFVGEDKSFYEYFIGFDNIKIGLVTFDSVAVFSSKPKKINNLGQAAVQVNEKRPIGEINSINIEYTKDTYPLSTNDYFHGSIEYYLVKKDFSSVDALLNTDTFPVLPLGKSRVRHERLLLNSKSSIGLSTNDTGFLQFFTVHDPYHATLAPEGDIIVYRNGQILPSFDLDAGVGDGWFKDTVLSNSVPNQKIPMRYSIRIQKPNPTAIYTVSYTPALSTINSLLPTLNPDDYIDATKLKLVDLTGGLRAWMGKDNIVYFKKTNTGSAIAYSTVSLSVVMRRNSANPNLTPVLEDYLLATGSYSLAKFGI